MDGQFIGSVNSVLDLRYFSKLIKISNATKSYQFAIFDAQNRIIVSTELEEAQTSFARHGGGFTYINSTTYHWLPSQTNLPPISRWQKSLYGQKVSCRR